MWTKAASVLFALNAVVSAVRPTSNPGRDGLVFVVDSALAIWIWFRPARARKVGAVLLALGVLSSLWPFVSALRDSASGTALFGAIVGNGMIGILLPLLVIRGMLREDAASDSATKPQT